MFDDSSQLPLTPLLRGQAASKPLSDRRQDANYCRGILSAIRFFRAVVLALLLAAPGRCVLAQSGAREPLATVQVTAAINAISANDFRASVDLGDLPAGTTAPCALKLVNATNVTFQIDTIGKTCGCLHIKPPPKASVAPGENVEIELSVDIPSTSTKAEGTQVITLSDPQGLSITVPIKYRIAGLVSFYGSGFNSAVVVGAKRHEFRVPFFFTSPARSRDLTLAASDSLSDLTTEIVREGDQWFVKCQLNSKTAITETLTGNLTLSDSKLDVKSVVRCILEVKKPVVVSPFVLRFTLREDDESAEPNGDAEYTATAVAAVDKTLLSTGGKGGKPEDAQEPIPTFRFTTPSKIYDVKTKRLSSGIYRLYLSVRFGQEDIDSLAALRKEGLAELFYSAKIGREVIRGKVQAVFK